MSPPVPTGGRNPQSDNCAAGGRRVPGAVPEIERPAPRGRPLTLHFKLPVFSLLRPRIGGRIRPNPRVVTGFGGRRKGGRYDPSLCSLGILSPTP
jgi:hypothetical protein